MMSGEWDFENGNGDGETWGESYDMESDSTYYWNIETDTYSYYDGKYDFKTWYDG